MAMLKGSWQYTKIVCGNHGDNESIEMIIQQGPHSMFYACPHYSAENRTNGEPMCFNRINLIEYENMLNHLANLMVEAEQCGQILNLKNYQWEKKGISYKVMKHNDKEIVVKILNKKALMR